MEKQTNSQSKFSSVLLQNLISKAKVQSQDFQSLMKSKLPHHTGFNSELKSFSADFSNRLYKDDEHDGILTSRMQANEPGFYEFWRTAERSLRLHNFGHLENLRIEAWGSEERVTYPTWGSEERFLAPIIIRAGRVFSTLKYLDLSLSKNIVDNKGIKLLGQQISNYFPNLEELGLSLFSCLEINSEGLKALARVIGLNLSKLQRLRMAITCAKEGNELDLIDFFKRLSRCGSKLTHLRVNISIDGDTKEENLVQIVSEIIKRFPDLQGLDLSYNCWRGINRVSDDSLITITDQITSKLQSLKSLSLDFSSCFGIRNKGMEIISQLIKTNKPNLQGLSLRFAQCDELTPIGLDSVANQLIPSLKDLKELSLDFSNVGRLTDDCFKNLMDQIYANLQNLKKLDMKFGNCWRISAIKWEKTASQLLEKLTNLKELNLRFSWNTFSDGTFNKLCEGIRKSEGQLKKCRIILDNCKDVSGRSKEKYREVFQKYSGFYIC